MRSAQVGALDRSKLVGKRGMDPTITLAVSWEPQGGAFILLLLAVSVTYGGRGGFNLLTMDKKFDILKEFCRCN